MEHRLEGVLDGEKVFGQNTGCRTIVMIRPKGTRGIQESDLQSC